MITVLVNSPAPETVVRFHFVHQPSGDDRGMQFPGGRFIRPQLAIYLCGLLRQHSHAVEFGQTGREFGRRDARVIVRLAAFAGPVLEAGIGLAIG